MSGVDSFRVEKRRVAATIELDTGKKLEGVFLCAPHSQEHAGRETVAELLNAAPRFVVFFAGEDARHELVNKRRIRLVRLGEADLPGDPELLADFAEPRKVRLELESGDTLEGDTRVSAPVGHTRTLDLLNETGLFLHLDAGDDHLIVNLDFVVVAEGA